MTTPIWHALTSEQVLSELDVNIEQGLSPEEAKRRLETYGRNELKEQPRPGFWSKLFAQFKNLVVILLIAASLISALLGEWPEAIAIMLIVVLNAIIGVVQEGKAEEALAALKKMSAPDADVRRGGHVISVPGVEIVPGDIVLLDAGNYIPSDLRLVEIANMRVDEASLTGESLPVDKFLDKELAEDAGLGDRKNMAYKSTLVTYGRGVGVIVSTGMKTEIGKIAEMIQSVEDEDTPLQIRLDQLGAWLVYGALVVCGIVFFVAFWRAAREAAFELGLNTLNEMYGAIGHDDFKTALRDAGLEAFLTAVALAIAAVPEGLPAIVTINLALGMQEMLKRNALIRRLPAVETLGSASVICSDKTGTLTQNEMTAVRAYVPGEMLTITGKGYSPEGHFENGGKEVEPFSVTGMERLLRGAALSSDAQLEEDTSESLREYRLIGDPTEGAMVVAALKAGLEHDQLAETYPRIDEIPFDSARKRMSTIHKRTKDGDVIMYVKGAPDVLLDLCTQVYEGDKTVALSDGLRESITGKNKEMAQQALRVLAVAERRFETMPGNLTIEEHEKDLTFVGLVGMIDPARPEVKPAIARAREAGIKTVMVTGDYPDTARAIAQEIGLMQDKDGRVVTGAELEKTSEADLVKMVEGVDVFARVSPEHKVRIVDAFRQNDHVVAMTGDGVNDAPALKRASIGVAMGITGTDVSKETADMVLTDDNYVSIVNAVEQGRVIYDNIRKFVSFLLTCNLAEIMVIFLATLMGAPSPLTAIQLLWLNLLTDGAPALALGVEKADPDIMGRKPRPQNEPIIDGIMRINLVVQTIFITGVTLYAFFSVFDRSLDGVAADANLVHARSMAFTVLSFSELLRAYSARSEIYNLIVQINPFSNKWMQYAIAGSVFLLIIVIYVPFLNPIFNTQPLPLVDWFSILPLMIIPTAASEITKVFLRLYLSRKQETVATVS